MNGRDNAAKSNFDNFSGSIDSIFIIGAEFIFFIETKCNDKLETKVHFIIWRIHFYAKKIEFGKL